VSAPLLILNLVAAAIVVAASVIEMIQSRPAPPDPRIKIVERYEAGLITLISERYQCANETAREIRERYLVWEMDAIGQPVRFAEDGKLLVDSSSLNVLDRCALEIGVRPDPKGAGYDHDDSVQIIVRPS
jgi:hypothetical protein